MATLFGPVELGRMRLRSVWVLDETVHERVRRLRERKNLSQKDIADATGGVVSESWLSKFEKARRPKNPTREQLEPLAGPLGVSLSYLMAPMRVTPIEDATVRPDAVVIAGKNYKGLNEDELRLLGEMADRLLGSHQGNDS